MQKAKKFNTKEITRVTVRFYDGEFVNKLTLRSFAPLLLLFNRKTGF